MHSRWFRIVGVTALIAVTLALLAWFIIGPLPHWSVGDEVNQLSVQERLAAVDTIRGQCIQLAGTLSSLAGVAGGLVTVAYGIRRYFLDKEKQRLDQDKHLTSLFDSASGRLDSEDPTVRAGGVRTLHRLAVDSPRDHELVVGTVGDVLRQRAVPPASPEQQHRRLPYDVLAAVDALRLRPDRTELRPLDLAKVHLPGAYLAHARLTRANFSSAQLEKADFTGADLTRADLHEVQLTDAALTEANLTEALMSHAVLTGAGLAGATAAGTDLADAVLDNADLTGANLERADLRRASLRSVTVTGTRLSGADLTDADLRGTDLYAALGLTSAAVRTTIIDADTVLPDGVTHPRRRTSPSSPIS
jgi:uncharacterized protein YjbI with pentapeptide repeats